MRCEETAWTTRTPGGGYTTQHRVPCPNRARFMATDGERTTRLCGVHANTGRWADWPGIEWQEIKKGKVTG